jgi:hypothetical protein
MFIAVTEVRKSCQAYKTGPRPPAFHPGYTFPGLKKNANESIDRGIAVKCDLSVKSLPGALFQVPHDWHIKRLTTISHSGRNEFGPDSVTPMNQGFHDFDTLTHPSFHKSCTSSRMMRCHDSAYFAITNLRPGIWR